MLRVLVVAAFLCLAGDSFAQSKSADGTFSFFDSSKLPMAENDDGIVRAPTAPTDDTQSDGYEIRLQWCYHFQCTDIGHRFRDGTTIRFI